MATVGLTNASIGAPHVPDFARGWFTASIAVHTSIGSCDILDMRALGGVSIKPPASVTALTFYGAESATGTFVLINDAGTAGVLAVTAERWVAFPDACFAHGFVKVLSTSATGTALVVGKN